MQKPIIVITGPTASGKTAMSFELACKYNGEVLAIDSMTVYRGMDIGTDKPSSQKNLKVEKKDSEIYIEGIRHHLLDIVDPSEEMNAAILKEHAQKAIEDIHARGKVPFLVGGSTLYMDSIVYNYQMPEVQPDQKLREELEKESTEDLFKKLVELDPDCEWTIDRQNKRRVIRALEVVMSTGKPFCDQKKSEPLPKNVLYLALKRDREVLYKKINKRVDEMMAEGFLEEVKTLQQKYPNSVAMQAAGYKQLSDYLNGSLSLEEAVEKTKQIHRNFAKRQMTWLNRNQDIKWVETKDEADQLVAGFLAN